MEEATLSCFNCYRGKMVYQRTVTRHDGSYKVFRCSHCKHISEKRDRRVS